jgi:hypothetical protein
MARLRPVLVRSRISSGSEFCDGGTGTGHCSGLIRSLEGLIEVRRRVDEGAPLFRAYVDRASAAPAGDLIARYHQLGKRFQVLFAAMGARNRQVDRIRRANGRTFQRGCQGRQTRPYCGTVARSFLIVVSFFIGFNRQWPPAQSRWRCRTRASALAPTALRQRFQCAAAWPFQWLPVAASCTGWDTVPDRRAMAARLY